MMDNGLFVLIPVLAALVVWLYCEGDLFKHW
jgi:hypothetical protein